MPTHEYFMRKALEQAERAGRQGEVPVGAVIVYKNRILAAGHNRRERGADATAHAEVLAIRRACKKLGSWRLDGCALYVTLEPCPMCAGAILNARLPAVYYGATDPAMGVCKSVLHLFEEPLGHRPAIVSGILEEECRALLSGFFKALR